MDEESAENIRHEKEEEYHKGLVTHAGHGGVVVADFLEGVARDPVVPRQVHKDLRQEQRRHGTV